jgi:hypothetical protein
MAKINKDDLKIGVTFTRCKDCDRVEVVRCKDCEHFSKEASKSYDGHFCEVWLDYIKPNDFCSYGERVIK